MAEKVPLALDEAIGKAQSLYHDSLSLLKTYRDAAGAGSIRSQFSKEEIQQHCKNILFHTFDVRKHYSALAIEGLDFSDDSARQEILGRNGSLESAIKGYSQPKNDFNDNQNGEVYAQAVNLFAFYALLTIAKKRSFKEVTSSHVKAAKEIAHDKRYQLSGEFMGFDLLNFERKMERIRIAIGKAIEKELER